MTALSEAVRLDTSGEIEGRRWSDLLPIEQGHILALFNGALRADVGDGAVQMTEPLGFRHLAPETLDQLRKECEMAVDLYEHSADSADAGWMFFRERQEGLYHEDEIRPVVAYVKGGKLYLREIAE